MCGITGILLAADSPSADALDLDVLWRMTTALRHRGPDDSGTWRDVSRGIALGHRRLSIIDLSPEGHQPMVSASERYLIAFNGEIYNFRELRAQLEADGHGFRGHSDTEVLLAAIDAWGLDAALARANGMFALALWDRGANRLHLARDRLGKKPLYYGWAGRNLVFGSELKALLAHPEYVPVVSHDALALLLRYEYIPAPWSIVRDTFKLAAGTTLAFSRENVSAGPTAHDPGTAARYYWDPRVQAQAAMDAPFRSDRTEARAELDRLLRDAVRLRMYADVPIGAFLSGGIDSSLVTALMQAQSSRPVRTFSIGFDVGRYDESADARRVAGHLGTEHTDLIVTASDALAVVPDLPSMFDEPFADSSEIPTALVARLAREQVTVAVSGDGGDELFGGYRRYPRALSIWRWGERCPQVLRDAALHLLRSVGSRESRGSRLATLRDELQAVSARDVYHNRVSRWRYPESAIPGAVAPGTAYTLPEWGLAGASPAEQMMFADATTYLPEDILTKVDRTSMAVSLEVRAPLLDFRVVEFAWSLPVDMKLYEGRSKWLLRELLGAYVPAELVDRPKQGFGSPVASWLRGSLRDWAEDLLAAQRLERDGHFDVATVRDTWTRFLRGERKWHTHLWSILMFQAWLDWVRTQAVGSADAAS